MTPLEYGHTIVMPTMLDALVDRGDQRRVYLACIVVFHLADYIALEEAGADPEFATAIKGERRRAVEAKRKSLLREVGARQPDAFGIVEAITNGTKHPERLPLLPGTERLVPAFQWESGEVEGTRWEGAGLEVTVNGERVYLDICAQQVLAAFVAERPDLLAGLDPSGLDPSYRW